MNNKPTIRTNLAAIFLLPLLCGFIFLFYYFKTFDKSFAYASLIIFLYSGLCFLITSHLQKKQQRLWEGQISEFSVKALKTVKIMTAFFVFTCAFLFILNMLLSIVPLSTMTHSTIALLFALFPQSLYMCSHLSITNAASTLSSFGIKIANPNAITLINESKILIIDEFDLFSNPELIFELSINHNIVLISKKSQLEIKSRFDKYFLNSKFCRADYGEAPVFTAENHVVIYPSASAYSVVSIIKNTNKPFVLVSAMQTDGLHLKITANTKINADVYLPDNSITCLVNLQKICFKAFSAYKKCFVYIFSLNIAKLICVFTSLFLCSQIPFFPLMLVISVAVCDFVSPISFIYDKAEVKLEKSARTSEDLTQIILDGCLIGIVLLIVYMAGAMGFSFDCARLICFNTYIFSALLYTFNIRSEKNVFLIGILTNKITNLAFFTGISCAMIISAFLYTDISHFGFSGWIMIITMSIIPFVVTQLQKAVQNVFCK